MLYPLAASFLGVQCFRDGLGSFVHPFAHDFINDLCKIAWDALHKVYKRNKGAVENMEGKLDQDWKGKWPVDSPMRDTDVIYALVINGGEANARTLREWLRSYAKYQRKLADFPIESSKRDEIERHRTDLASLQEALQLEDDGKAKKGELRTLMI